MQSKPQEVFLTDSYLRELEATVIKVNDEGIILDKTIFYPRGGGQPEDKGIIIFEEMEIKVLGLKRLENKILLALEVKLEVGNKVIQKIDWDYRYKLMKHHTALHILSAIVWKKFDAKVTGGTIYHNKARLDFDLTEFNSQIAENLIVELNQAIAKNHNISIEFVLREEAEKDQDLIRTKINLLPPHVKEIRLVKIGNIDIQADGGLHVKSTNEIGKIKLEKIENKGKGRKRISIAIIDET